MVSLYPRGGVGMPNIVGSYIEGDQARRRNVLAQAADRRARDALSMQREQMEFGRMDADRRFGLDEQRFGLQERAFEAQEARARAAAARAAAGAQRAAANALRDEERAELDRITATIAQGRTLQERVDLAAMLLDEEDQAAFGSLARRSSTEGPVNPYDDLVLNAIRVHGGLDPLAVAEPYEPLSAEGKRHVDEQRLGVDLSERGWRTLSQEEAAARGLDPEKTWQEGPRGELQVRGGSLVDVTIGDKGSDAPEVLTTGNLAGYAVSQGEPTPENPTGAQLMLVPNSPQALAAQGAVQRASDALTTVRTLGSFKNLENYVGRYGGNAPDTSAGAREFAALYRQLGGQVFLQAIDTLRGTGALSEIESQQGKEAISRVDRGLEPAAFRRALNDVEQILSRGIDRQNQLLDASGISMPSAGIVFNGETLQPGAQIEVPTTGGVVTLTVRNGMLEDEQGNRYDATGAPVR